MKTNKRPSMLQLWCATLLCMMTMSTNAQCLHTGNLGSELRLRPYEHILPSQSKSNYTQQMDGYTTSDEYEEMTFTYDSWNRLVQCHETVRNSYELIDSVSYDGEGQLVRIDGWQLIDDCWSHVYYIEYTYVDGHIATRKNYNHFSGSWELGGTYTYSYEEGRLTHTELVFAGDDEVFQTVDYTYGSDDAHLLQRELWRQRDFYSGEMANSECLTYRYDGGRLTTIHDSIWNVRWEHYGHHLYEYDANGNCTAHHRYDEAGSEVERSEYEYNNQALNQTLMPSHPELSRPFNVGSVNTYTVEHWYQVDANLVFQYAWDYLYEYSGHEGIAAVEAEKQILYPNPASSHVTISGAQNEDYIIYDLGGRKMRQGILNHGVADLSGLSAGRYTILLPATERRIPLTIAAH